MGLPRLLCLALRHRVARGRDGPGWGTFLNQIRQLPREIFLVVCGQLPALSPLVPAAEELRAKTPADQPRKELGPVINVPLAVEIPPHRSELVERFLGEHRREEESTDALPFEELRDLVIHVRCSGGGRCTTTLD